MLRIATRVFIASSVAVGLVGIFFALTIPLDAEAESSLNFALFRLLAAIGFVVLSSFALSVAARYLRSE